MTSYKTIAGAACVTATVDRLAFIKAQIAELQTEETALKQALIQAAERLGKDALLGTTHRATIAHTKPPCALCGEPIDYTLSFLADKHGAKCRKPDCLGCVPDPMRFEVDHIVPLSRGGAHEQANLQWTHLVCNLRKGTKLPTDTTLRRRVA